MVSPSSYRETHAEALIRLGANPDEANLQEGGLNICQDKRDLSWYCYQHSMKYSWRAVYLRLTQYLAEPGRWRISWKRAASSAISFWIYGLLKIRHVGILCKSIWQLYSLLPWIVRFAWEGFCCIRESRTTSKTFQHAESLVNRDLIVIMTMAYENVLQCACWLLI